MSAHKKCVVVGYENRMRSAEAVRWGAREAYRRNADLVVLHVMDSGAVTYREGPVGHDGWWPDDVIDKGAILADEGADIARVAAPGVRVLTLALAGPAGQRLVEASVDTELLVVGPPELGRFASLWLRSVSDAVTAHAHGPIVVVRGDTGRSIGPDRPVVVGVDGPRSGHDPLDFAARTALSAGAPLIVVSTWYYFTDPASAGADPAPVAAMNWLREPAEAAVDAAVAVARNEYPTLEVVPRVIAGVPPRVLTDAATDASLLVVGVPTHPALSGLLAGAVSHTVIRSSPCPVALIATGPRLSRQDVKEDHRAAGPAP